VPVRSSAIGMSVCLSVCPLTYLKIMSKFHEKLSIHVTWCRGSVLLRQQYNMLYTSGSVDDVMFSPNRANGPESKTTRMFCPVRQVAAAGAKLLSTIADFLWMCVTCQLGSNCCMQFLIEVLISLPPLCHLQAWKFGRIRLIERTDWKFSWLGCRLCCEIISKLYGIRYSMFVISSFLCATWYWVV